MKPFPWRVAVVLAAFLVFLAVAGVAILRVVTDRPLHRDPSALPSAPDPAPADRYAGAAEESRQRARALMVTGNVPGLSVAVAVDGEIVWAEAFGWIDVALQTGVTPRTRFRLGALSKPLTATAAALLHDQGRLDLDAPVQRYVPAYPQKQWTVTTRQLMGDVAGVHRIRGDNNDAMPTSHCGSVADAVEMLAGDPLQFEPGTQHRYSIWGWVLVSAAIEGAAGERFDRVMARQLFEPLGMTRTDAAPTAGVDADLPHYAPHTPFGVQLGKEEAMRPDYSCVAGGGAFVSTPSDLVRLGSVMLKPGVLKAETIMDFQTPTRLASGATTTYALGWTVGTAQIGGESARMISHRGSPAGGSVSLLVFPDLGLAVAVAGNAASLSSVNLFALKVAESFSRR